MLIFSPSLMEFSYATSTTLYISPMSLSWQRQKVLFVLAMAKYTAEHTALHCSNVVTSEVSRELSSAASSISRNRMFLILHRCLKHSPSTRQLQHKKIRFPQLIRALEDPACFVLTFAFFQMLLIPHSLVLYLWTFLHNLPCRLFDDPRLSS